MKDKPRLLRPAFVGGYVLLLVREAAMIAVAAAALNYGMETLREGGTMTGNGMLLYLIAHLALYTLSLCACILMRRQARAVHALPRPFRRALAFNYFFLPLVLVAAIPYCASTASNPAADMAAFFVFLFFDLFDLALCVWGAVFIRRVKKEAACQAEAGLPA